MNFEEIKMKNQPEEIYLNLGDDIDCDDYNELVESEIGWSTEPCTTDVLRYVRADLQDEEVINVSLRDHLAGLRDKVAMAALQGMLARPAMRATIADAVEWAYGYADAMLKEREK